MVVAYPLDLGHGKKIEEKTNIQPIFKPTNKQNKQNKNTRNNKKRKMQQQTNKKSTKPTNKKINK